MSEASGIPVYIDLILRKTEILRELGIVVDEMKNVSTAAAQTPVGIRIQMIDELTTAVDAVRAAIEAKPIVVSVTADTSSLNVPGGGGGGFGPGGGDRGRGEPPVPEGAEEEGMSAARSRLLLAQAGQRGGVPAQYTEATRQLADEELSESLENQLRVRQANLAARARIGIETGAGAEDLGMSSGEDLRLRALAEAKRYAKADEVRAIEAAQMEKAALAARSEEASGFFSEGSSGISGVAAELSDLHPSGKEKPAGQEDEEEDEETSPKKRGGGLMGRLVALLAVHAATELAASYRQNSITDMLDAGNIDQQATDELKNWESQFSKIPIAGPLAQILQDPTGGDQAQVESTLRMAHDQDAQTAGLKAEWEFQDRARYEARQESAPNRFAQKDQELDRKFEEEGNANLAEKKKVQDAALKVHLDKVADINIAAGNMDLEAGGAPINVPAGFTPGEFESQTDAEDRYKKEAGGRELDRYQKEVDSISNRFGDPAQGNLTPEQQKAKEDSQTRLSVEHGLYQGELASDTRVAQLRADGKNKEAALEEFKNKQLEEKVRAAEPGSGLSTEDQGLLEKKQAAELLEFQRKQSDSGTHFASPLAAWKEGVIAAAASRSGGVSGSPAAEMEEWRKTHLGAAGRKAATEAAIEPDAVDNRRAQGEDSPVKAAYKAMHDRINDNFAAQEAVIRSGGGDQATKNAQLVVLNQQRAQANQQNQAVAGGNYLLHPDQKHSDVLNSVHGMFDHSSQAYSGHAADLARYRAAQHAKEAAYNAAHPRATHDQAVAATAHNNALYADPHQVGGLHRYATHTDYDKTKEYGDHAHAAHFVNPGHEAAVLANERQHANMAENQQAAALVKASRSSSEDKLHESLQAMGPFGKAADTLLMGAEKIVKAFDNPASVAIIGAGTQ